VLRALEREATDRLKGLDTRPFDYLLDQASAAAGVIGDEDALAAEDGLSRCPQSIPPVRRVCTEAAHALVSLIEQQAAGSATTQAKQVEAKQAEAKQAEAKQAEAKQAEAKQAEAKQAEAKQAYARAMPQCERWMDFAPLVTVFRTSD
jgi:septum formation inhibitor MinC